MSVVAMIDNKLSVESGSDVEGTILGVLLDSGIWHFVELTDEQAHVLEMVL